VIRDIEGLTSTHFDLAIVGGGIYGACAAWDAALRGLSVALIERGDFGHATSAQTLRVVHGGLRYLQHADLKRIRQSDHERKTLLRLAPHLVRLLPVLLPTFCSGIQHRTILRAALAAHDLLSLDRNRGIRDPGRKIPAGRMVSRDECLRLAPGLARDNVTGAAVFYDAQMHNNERLTLAFVRSAADRGACVANYIEAQGVLRRNGRVDRIEAIDMRTGNRIGIRADVVLNTAGPWVFHALSEVRSSEAAKSIHFAKTMNVVVRSPLTNEHAIALSVPRGRAQEGRARLLYITPWHGHAMIGSAHFNFDEHPDHCRVEHGEIAAFLEDVRAAYPGVSVTDQDVTFVRYGLVPKAVRAREPTDTARHNLILNHAREGLSNVISIVGVKYTTARYVAQKAVDLAARHLGRNGGPSRSATTPLRGGDIESFQSLVEDLVSARPNDLPEPVLRQLADSYGSEYQQVLRHVAAQPRLGNLISSTSNVIQAQVVHAVEEEMALTLSDVVFRRTALATAGHPGHDSLETCAQLMAEKLGWTNSRIASEIAVTEQMLARSHSRTPRATTD
jgi:glycerol-3-phosphate dehydrogenase